MNYMIRDIMRHMILWYDHKYITALVAVKFDTLDCYFTRASQVVK
jgi:hypothetical protein